MPKVRGFYNWEAIKDDYCRGDLTIPQMAQKWRIKEGTLSGRASREKWPTPARFKMAMSKAVEVAGELVAQGLRNSEVPGSDEALAMLGLRSGPNASRGQNDPTGTVSALDYQAAMAHFAVAAAQRGFGKIKAPGNWRELSICDNLARRALGLDTKNGGGAAAMVRITGGNGAGPVDVAVGVSLDGPEMPDDDE